LLDNGARRIVVVVHDPGKPEGLNIANDIVGRAAEKLANMGIRANVDIEVISRLEEEKALIKAGDLVYGLFLARGGHWQTIEDYTTRENATLLGKPSPSKLGMLLSNRVNGCQHVSVVYWPAKRYRERHYADTLEFAKSIAGGSTRLDLVEAYKLKEAEGCIVIAAMMPGRLIDRAIEYGKNVLVPFILSNKAVIDYAANDIVDKAVRTLPAYA